MKTLQVSFENRNGHTLRGFATLPDGVEKAPCVLMLHGFTGNAYGHKGMNTQIARGLADQGIACVRFDFYGNGESDGEFEDFTFTGLYEDTEDMFAWMSKQSFVDPENLYLSGQSMGGYVAASCAPRIHPKGLLLLCPGAGMWFGCAQRADAVVDMGQDWVDLEGLKYNMAFNYDMAKHPIPFEEAKGYEGPAFIVRASDDQLVDERTVQTYAGCYNEVETMTTDGGGHNFTSIPARQALIQAMSAFIKKHS